MTTLWQILKPEDKLKLARLYQELAGFEFVPPDHPDQAVCSEGKLESLEEIDRIMRKPGRGAWHA